MKNSQTIQNELNALKAQRDEMNQRIGFLETEFSQSLKNESGNIANSVDAFIDGVNTARENAPNPFSGGKR
jgi:hypothetical protein